MGPVSSTVKRIEPMTEATDMPLTPGDTLFEYRITRALGQGAFGTVYLAQDTLLDRPVAIKELTAAAQADWAAFQRFLQEARAAGSLNHPNIVTIYALKSADATVYLVMEYLPGGSLRTLLTQRGRLPVDDAVRIAADVCDGLAAAHAKGIVHRDIKPENILLTADGRAKVGDFGIAHVPRTAGGAYAGGLTQTGFQPGTLIYMSPEQIRGEAVDGRSDVYQVGALLYEMLAGRHYIDVDTLTRRAQERAGGNVLRPQARLFDLLEEAICKHEPQDVCRLRPDVPGRLGATTAAMLARHAATRPTAEHLVEMLRREKNSRLSQQPPTAPNRIQRVPVAQQGALDEAEVHFDLGFAYMHQGRTDEAIREYQAALRINPDYAEAHNNLAACRRVVTLRQAGL
jgi:serine/threonine protein kinase